MFETAGRSPDLRIVKPVRLPIPSPEQLLGRFSTLTVAGLCRFTGFPYWQSYVYECTLNPGCSWFWLRLCVLFFFSRSGRTRCPRRRYQPDKKKSQAALQRGKRRKPASATSPSRRSRKPSRPTRERGCDARPRQGLPVGGRSGKAQADLDKAAEIAPARPNLPGTRHVLCRDQPGRAGHSRSHTGHQPQSGAHRDLHGARKAYTAMRQYDKALRISPGDQAAAGQLGAVPRPGIARAEQES